MNRWRRLSDYFSALQWRERALITLAIAVISLAACDSLLWSPLGVSTKALQNQLNQLQQQRQGLQMQRLDISAQLMQDPDRNVRQQLDAVRTRINTQNQKMQALMIGLIPPGNMSTALRDLLNQRKRLKVVALANDPAVRAFAKLHKAADPNEKSELAPVYKHGLTLILKGSYFDVLDYLQAVESLPWHFFWERLDYRVAHYPEAEVTIRVYTLGDHEEWIGA
jgi:MSHA biogenesis protein MshJ